MATLQGQQIDQTYGGLIKTANNAAGAPFPPAKLQYGDGTELPILIGDGSGVGVGDIVSLQSGQSTVEVNSNGVNLIKFASADAQAGTATFVNGAFNFGLGFPGAPATTVDFTNATVTGLPSGAAGLENGTGTDSLQSAAALTTNAADASGNYSIALGDGASATRQESVAIGQNAAANGTGSDGSIAIGNGAVASSNRSVVIGVNNSSSSSEGIAIGDDVDIAASDRSIGIGGAINISGGNDKIGIGTSATVGGTRGVAIGQNATADGANTIAMGYGASATGPDSVVLGLNASDGGTNQSIIIGAGANAQTDADDFSVVIGRNAQSTVSNGIAIGQDAQSDGTNTIMIGSGAAGTFNTVGIGVSVSANSNESIAIGYDADTQSGSNNSIAIGVYSECTTNSRDSVAIGQTASARANGAVALGKQVIASKVDTVSVQALETQTNSTPTAGGIIMADAGGTERRLNITATGDLQIDGNAVGGGGTTLHAMGGNLEGRTYYDSNQTANTYRTWVNTSGYGTAAANVSNRAAYALFSMVPGEDINKLAIRVHTNSTGATGEIAFYDTAINADGFIYINNRLQSLGTVDMGTTGWKEITLGTPFTVPTGLSNNLIAVVAFPSTTAANFSGWTNTTNMVGQGIFLTGGVPYRALHMHVNPGVTPGTTLPAVIGDAGGGVDYKASTNYPLSVMVG